MQRQLNLASVALGLLRDEVEHALFKINVAPFQIRHVAKVVRPCKTR
jgi:hypothetical protein